MTDHPAHSMLRQREEQMLSNLRVGPGGQNQEEAERVETLQRRHHWESDAPEFIEDRDLRREARSKEPYVALYDGIVSSWPALRLFGLVACIAATAQILGSLNPFWQTALVLAWVAAAWCWLVWRGCQREIQFLRDVEDER